ncbi:MAG: glycosyltransferase family 2 protein [Gemmataceae bacterium]
MDQATRKLSIVCPAFQEEEVLPHFHKELAATLDLLAGNYDVEILYIDDGSLDRTLEVIKDLARNDARVRYLSFSRNFGHQAALTAGLENAAGEAVITMDSDLQHPPTVIPALLERWKEGFDVVLTIREDDADLGTFKRFTSGMFYRTMRLLSDTEIRFAAADYRLMSRKAVDGLLELRETHRFLRGMVQWLGFRTAEVRFMPARRKAGLSKYNFRRMANFAADGIVSFSRMPLRIAFFIGLLCLALSFFFAAWGCAGLLGLESRISLGTCLVLTSLHYVGGSILCALGLIGEYVGRIYEQVKGRPIYLIKDSSLGHKNNPAEPGNGQRPWNQRAQDNNQGRSAA